jgi:hypothetical protein
MNIRSRTKQEQQAIQQSIRSNRAKRLEAINAFLDALLSDQSLGTQLLQWALSQVKKARKGSTPSLIALKCGDCVSWQRNGIRDCTSESCPLFPSDLTRDVLVRKQKKRRTETRRFK